ncbi:MAG TPA: hypothetical protein VFN97_20875 [Actinospica sp.]|nr:hypothetical protein [Actinospica sp.]
MPILIALGGALVFFVRHDEMRVSHLFVAALVGAQISTTAMAGEINSVFSAANHILSTVFT